MPELKSYVCPNCGANTTDYVNCEYCGSLLVRFVEKGIDLSQTTYTSNDATFPGLIEELQNNLLLQEGKPDAQIATLILPYDENGLFGSVICTKHAIWDDETPIKISDNELGLIIKFTFTTNVQPGDDNEGFLRSRNQHALFRQLHSFELFTKHVFTENYGKELLVTEYAIDFGKDAEGAARLISDVLINVYGVDLTEPIKYSTGDFYIDEETKKAYDELIDAIENKSKTSEVNNSSNEGCLGGIVAILGVCIGALGSVIAAIVSLIN